MYMLLWFEYNYRALELLKVPRRLISEKIIFPREPFFVNFRVASWYYHRNCIHLIATI